MGQNIRNIEEQGPVCMYLIQRSLQLCSIVKEKKKITTGNTDRAFHDKAFYEGKKMTLTNGKYSTTLKMGRVHVKASFKKGFCSST